MTGPQKHTDLNDETFYAGNSFDISGPSRGWFVGSFMPASPLHRDDVEIKYTHHPPGDERLEWGSSPMWSMSLITSGHFRLIFRDREVDLSRDGDFTVWGPGIEHRWVAVTASSMVTVRWP
jgi:quercetin dioxygenase-like cupin family protein